MSTDVSGAAHWTQIARRWGEVGPPLRPSAADVAVYSKLISHRVAPRALILGVTPELRGLPWPAGTRLVAVDHTLAMIEAIWPGPRSAVVCGDWTALPFAKASRDLALCDGGLHLMSSPRGQSEFVRALARVVAPGGTCVLRLFLPPARRESPDAVLADLVAARVPNLNVLKLRLAMSMQDDAVRGVRLADVWNAVHGVAPDLDRLAAKLGWTREHAHALDTYRDCPATYHFTDLTDVTRLFCEEPGGFEREALVPAGEWGVPCPIVAFRRVSGSSPPRSR